MFFLKEMQIITHSQISPNLHLFIGGYAARALKVAMNNTGDLHL